MCLCRFVSRVVVWVWGVLDNLRNFIRFNLLWYNFVILLGLFMIDCVCCVVSWWWVIVIICNLLVVSLVIVLFMFELMFLYVVSIILGVFLMVSLVLDIEVENDLLE